MPGVTSHPRRRFRTRLFNGLDRLWHPQVKVNSETCVPVKEAGGLRKTLNGTLNVMDR